MQIFFSFTLYNAIFCLIFLSSKYCLSFLYGAEQCDDSRNINVSHSTIFWEGSAVEFHCISGMKLIWFPWHYLDISHRECLHFKCWVTLGSHIAFLMKDGGEASYVFKNASAIMKRLVVRVLTYFCVFPSVSLCPLIQPVNSMCAPKFRS